MLVIRRRASVGVRITMRNPIWLVQRVLALLTRFFCFGRPETCEDLLQLTCLVVNNLGKQKQTLSSTATEEPYIVTEVRVRVRVVQVTYLSGVHVDMGNELTPAQVKDVPTVTWMADPGALYTLCMIDLDAPSRQQPQFREINHWLVMNIPGSRLDQGDCLAEYRGSGPPKGTGLHRYVFLLYKQSGKLQCDEPRLGYSDKEGRRSYSIRQFAAKYKLGEPVAGNFYQAQWDEYVSTLSGK